MMKRFLSILLAMCMMLTMLPVLAANATSEEETVAEGVASNPYTSEGLGVTFALPDTVQVVSETAEEGSGAVVITLSQDGREDRSYNISVTQNTDYAGYTMMDLPDEIKQQFIDYYAEAYPGANPPAFTELTEDMEVFEQCFSPFMAFGTGADGNFYAIYVCVFNTFVLTVSGGIAATADDVDSDFLGTVFNLYWQSADAFYTFLDGLGMFGE